MKTLFGILAFALVITSCATTTPTVINESQHAMTETKPQTAPVVEESPSVEPEVKPYLTDEKCKSFHDNDLVGMPYAMGFHYCLYAEGLESIVGCFLDAENHRSVCVNSDQNPEIGVLWHESPGIADGNMYVPQFSGAIATVHGELMSVEAGRVMQYLVTYTDGTHSSCIVGGPTVQYCRIDW